MVPMMAHQKVHFLELHLRGSLLYPSEGSLVVTIMAHNGVPCLELHLRSTAVGPTRGDFFSPDLIYILGSFSLYAPTMAEAVGRNSLRF